MKLRMIAVGMCIVIVVVIGIISHYTVTESEWLALSEYDENDWRVGSFTETYITPNGYPILEIKFNPSHSFMGRLKMKGHTKVNADKIWLRVDTLKYPHIKHWR